MKNNVTIIAFLALLLGMMSCGKDENSMLVGTWGVERIEYYYIDYYGQPISSTLKVYEYTPGDTENGIEMVFYENKRGEWRDHDIDTFLVQVSINPVTYDTIVNPDTTLVIPFKYSFDKDLNSLTIKTADAETYMLDVEALTQGTFVYINQFKTDYVERSVLKRIDGKSKVQSSGKASPKAPRPEGSMYRTMSFDK